MSCVARDFNTRHLTPAFAVVQCSGRGANGRLNVCVCDPGYAGNDCSLPIATLQSLQSVRARLFDTTVRADLVNPVLQLIFFAFTWLYRFPYGA